MSEISTSCQKIIEHLDAELKTIRTGRSTPELVDGIFVEVWGSKQPLKAVASISTPDSKTIQIEPWDSSVVKLIEVALTEADLGMMPNVQGKVIRLVMPMMTDENRQHMVKKVKEKTEDTRVSIRRVREEVKKGIEKQEGIGEDEKHGQLEAMEKEIKSFVEKADAMGKKKEDEITTI
ncbi:MAG: Ribosome-recycling factor [Candidatus Uhrbacteria bacterium GW2011_GWD2_41_121]|uniref:Ribosome-recycling factor n=1 Tax=Candidatus Uhrbacteria bacterium GW2011_GWC1_41_20 TaxID=1618983 RepID=A0A0G0XS21_9BACT|nr:MAG: Ribosome-recycling factor [Candidatus Uhrbacteria bacterium GW2011_GWE1_39_46]KKR64285.1 MAG: Ribosome-recycling factor [Candidatus Uhrbacteria bacterium GW2011_GWC2_40_450]KKR90455.1 MAG: Ribosome-recycling factor [Candidatus Uhrbacteria bacterium GW2011_GWD2_41_121]KKR96182.1 MAG: Ribosome-recycling factor [Candidatus Uhrbacteria bacterium GW2011_GWD1_41_16]KKR99720.1 MAG: Ribosome-recycling factor [Candidatus Uhrbacteria bacterium GW2011_GWC1_41_20]KKS06293.1 MAG: Ribosome-recycling